MHTPVSQIACETFERHDTAIARLARALQKAHTELGRRELAIAMCVKANQLLNCRRRSGSNPQCAICHSVAAARRNGVAQLILDCGAPVDPWAAMSETEPARRYSWRPIRSGPPPGPVTVK